MSRTMNTSTESNAARSQTLSRGLTALEFLAAAERPVTIDGLAAGLGVHRSNAYRLLRTLEEHRFAVRDQAGLIRLGPKLTTLARGVAPALNSAATPAITELAYALGVTAFLTVLDADEVVTLVAVEPSNVAATIARNPGVRHSVLRGAPGRAIEAYLSRDERAAHLGDPEHTEAALEARRLGYALSENEVIAGVTALAVPLRIAGEPPAAVAVVHFSLPGPVDEVVDALRSAADKIALSYR